MGAEDKIVKANITLDEANKYDDEESLYFKPLTNIQYELGFSKWELRRKMVPGFTDKTKLEEKTELFLLIDLKNGKIPPKGTQVWTSLTQSVRQAFEAHLRSGAITKHIFSLCMKEVKGKTHPQPQVSIVRAKTPNEIEQSDASLAAWQAAEKED